MTTNVGQGGSAATETRSSGLGPAAVGRLLAAHFPEVRVDIGDVEIRHCGDGRADVRLAYEARFGRPGGTISGPTMFKLADLACYVAILGVLGEAGIDAVTTTMTINFLARPLPEDLVCQVEILRKGRRQVACEARIFSGAAEKLVAQASCIYALPATPHS
jgi:uncharacterized protein (TIGR00369 family)